MQVVAQYFHAADEATELSGRVALNADAVYSEEELR